MIDIREYPKATELAIDILLDIGVDRKITAMKRLREFYHTPTLDANSHSDLFGSKSRMGLLEAKVIVESALDMIETWDELWLVSKTVRHR